MPSGRLWNKIARRHYHKQLDLHLARHASTAPRVPCRGVHVIPFAARSCDVKGSRRVSRERAGTTPVCCEKARLRSHQRRRPSARRPRTNRWSPRTLPAFGQPQVLNRCDDREECERANKPYDPQKTTRMLLARSGGSCKSCAVTVPCHADACYVFGRTRREQPTWLTEPHLPERWVADDNREQGQRAGNGW